MAYWSKQLNVRVVRQIAALPVDVFAAVNNNDNFFALRPTATDHQILEVYESGGHRCRQTYTAKPGCTTDVSAESIEFIPNSRMVDQCTTRTSTCRVVTTLEPDGHGTLVNMQYEYELKRRAGWLSRKIARAQLVKQYNDFFDRLASLVAMKN